MKAQRQLGLALSWPWITSAFLFDVGVLVLASHLPGAPQTVAWWVGVAVAAVVTIAVVLTYRGITVGEYLAGWVWDVAADMWNSSPDPEATLSPRRMSVIDHRRRFGREVVGVREYEGQLVAVIAVDGSADAPSGQHPHEKVSSATLPMAAVAATLRQFDVGLDAIDIVSVRKRHVSEAAHPSSPQTGDDRPAGVQHGTWLVLRMDPQHNVAAVAARDSVASTLAAAAERLAGDLHGRSCAARPLTGDELAEVDTTVAAGLQPAGTWPGWRHLKHPDGFATSFWVSPRDITSETLDWLWRDDTDATVVTIRLTAAAGRAEVSAWVRYHSRERLGKDVRVGLNHLTGRQLAAVRASLPAPAKRPPLVVPARALRDHEQLAVRVGPIEVGATPQHPMRPAELSDDAQRAAAVGARDADGRAADRTPGTPHTRERIVAAMTAQPPQPPPPLVPDGARPVGAAAAIVEDDDGGRVYVGANLAYAWDAGDAAGRRFAAVLLTRIKAATQLQVAAAFAVDPATLRRWQTRCRDAGVAGLDTQRTGPKRKSKLTPDTVAAIRRLRAGGASYRTVAATVGVSQGSVRNAIRPIDTGADADSDEPCAPTGSDKPLPHEQEPEVEVGSESTVDAAVAVIAAPPVAMPVFTACARAPLVGLALALPALTATGLIDTAREVYGEFGTGFYSLDTMLCEAVFRALLGEARAEAAAPVDPVALGRVLGLDRAPEVKTIRRKIRVLATAGKAGDWITAIAGRHLQVAPEHAAALYVDGHARAYQLTHKIAKTHVLRLKFPVPATVETWACDPAGDPLLAVMAEPAASRAGELRRMIPELRALVGDDRRVLVGFDRGGWSPALFADLHAAGFDTLTWRKGGALDIEEDLFAEHIHTDERGRRHTWRLADTETKLTIDDGPRKGEVFAMRQISMPDPARSRQTHILTTRRDLSAAEIRYRIGGRSRESDHRSVRTHFDLDSRDSRYRPLAGDYRAVHDDPNRTVPNPEKKPAYQRVEKHSRALHSAQAIRDRELPTASTPSAGTTTVLTNQILDTETTLIHHAIRLAAYNTARSLARAILTGTGYTCADDAAHTLVRTVLAGSGDIIPDHDTLHIRLDPLSAPRHTAAIAELCQALNTTDTVYPGTTLTLRYSVKPHRPPHTNC
jgi:type VII secretion protein EccE